MYEAEDFLEAFAHVVAQWLVVTPVEPAPPYDQLAYTEVDTSALWREYHALPRPLQLAIEAEWQEFFALAGSANAVHLAIHDLFARCAERLGVDADVLARRMSRHAGARTRLADVGGERAALGWTERRAASPAGPIEIPDGWPTTGSLRSRTWLATVSTVAGAAAAVLLGVLFLHSPSSSSEHPDRDRADEHRTIPVSEVAPLPVTNWEFATCEPATRPIPSRPEFTDAPTSTPTSTPTPASTRDDAPTWTTPKRRKAAKKQFVRDMDTVILRRENQPDLQMTVTEVLDEDQSGKYEPRRVYELDLKDNAGTGLEFGVSRDVVMVFEKQ